MSRLRRRIVLAAGIVAALSTTAALGAGSLLAAGYWPAILSRAELSGRTPVTLSIGGETVTIVAERLRFRGDRRPGEAPKAELLLTWPDLLPPAEDDPARLTTARDSRLVFITIAPRTTELDSADRIATIYQRFLAPGEADGPDGLVKRLFLGKTSYEGEELYFERGAVHPFVARCYPPRQAEPVLTCLRDVRLGRHLMATIRFPATALTDWRRLRDGLDALMADISGDTASGG